MREGERRGIREGEGRPTYRSRGPATTSCSHLARVIPATQWPLQVLVSCETPCFALRVPAGRRWRRRRRNVERELKQREDSTCCARSRFVSKMCHIAFTRGQRANRPDTSRNRYAHICHRVYWLLYGGEETEPARSHVNFGNQKSAGKSIRPRFWPQSSIFIVCGMSTRLLPILNVWQLTIFNAKNFD